MEISEFNSVTSLRVLFIWHVLEHYTRYPLKWLLAHFWCSLASCCQWQTSITLKKWQYSYVHVSSNLQEISEFNSVIMISMFTWHVPWLFIRHPIDPIHKWLPIKNSFVNIKISPANLVLELIIQKNFHFQTRLVVLI